MSGWGTGPWGVGPWGSGEDENNNLGFETAEDGLFSWALSWSSAWIRAAYPLSPIEGFETGWGGELPFGDLFGIETAIYMPNFPFEGFESGWNNTTVGVFTGVDAVYSGGSESFEIGWADTWSDNLNSFGLIPALYDVVEVGTSPPLEDFENQWDSNEDYLTSLPMPVDPSVEEAIYQQGSGFFAGELFEGVALDQVFAVNPSANTIIANSHGIPNGQVVRFRNEDGRLPQGLVSGYPYVVSTPTENDFQVSAGEIVDIQDFGFGVHYIIRDTGRYWTVQIG